MVERAVQELLARLELGTDSRVARIDAIVADVRDAVRDPGAALLTEDDVTSAL